MFIMYAFKELPHLEKVTNYGAFLNQLTAFSVTLRGCILFFNFLRVINLWHVKEGTVKENPG